MDKVIGSGGNKGIIGTVKSSSDASKLLPNFQHEDNVGEDKRETRADQVLISATDILNKAKHTKNNVVNLICGLIDKSTDKESDQKEIISHSGSINEIGTILEGIGEELGKIDSEVNRF